jgi:hypothetical protein
VDGTRRLRNKLAQVSNLRYYGRGGVDENGRPIEQHVKDWSMIASIASNAEGRNLQGWSNNLITSCPPNGSQIEQLLGRTHRDGQEADEVNVEVMLGCAENLESFGKRSETRISSKKPRALNRSY